MDVIRGLAILAVIAIHVSAMVLYRSTPYSKVYNITLILNQLSRFSVPAFILISGIGLTISYRENQSYSKFIVRRFLKIVPQYIIWCILYILLITKNFNIYDAINDMVYGKVFYHFYFVPLIVEFYLIFPFIYKFIGKRWWLLLSFSITTFFLIYTYYYKVVTPEEWFWNKKNLLYWLFYFSLGGYIGKNIENFLEKVHKYRFIIIVMFLASIYIVIYGFIPGSQYNKDIDYMTTFQRPAVLMYTIFFILFIFSFKWKNGFIMRIIRYVSNTSYDIYLSHAGILYFYSQYYVNKSMPLNSLHFELKAYIVTLFGAIIINEAKKLL